MSTDILGPASAQNAVTVRPSDTRVFSAFDSWFKDCTSALLNDGTKLEAAFMNAVLGSMRELIRGNGLTALAAPVVTEDNTDVMLLRAVQHLIQRNQTRYGDDTGTANTIVIAPTPAAKEYKKGMEMITKVAVTNLGASTLNVSGLGPITIKRMDGGALESGDLIAGQVAHFFYDGTFWQLVNARQNVIKLLTANTTFYVNGTTGHDTNYNGTAAVVSGVNGPFKTIQRAVNEGFKFGPSATYGITILVADNTYLEAVIWPTVPGPAITIEGNAITPANVHINSTGIGSAISVNGPNVGTIRHLKWTAGSANTAGVGANGAGASMFTHNTESGACASWCFLGNGGGAVNIGAHKFTGNVGDAFAAYRNGTINLQGAVAYNISTPIVVGGAFARVVSGGQIEVPATGTPTFTNPGNVTGKKYDATLNGVINTQGAGVNYFPGTVAGTNTTGGQYG
jgi:hypothetical protein